MFNDQYFCVYHGKFTAWFNDQKMAVKKFANTALNGKLRLAVKTLVSR